MSRLLHLVSCRHSCESRECSRGALKPSPPRGGLGGDGVAFIVSVSAKTDSRPCAVRPASLRAGNFLLLAHCAAGAARTAKPAPEGRRAGCPESQKVTKEKGTPTAPPTRHPASWVRERRPRFADNASCVDGERACIPARAPAGFFVRRSPSLTGTRSRAARSCAPKPKHRVALRRPDQAARAADPALRALIRPAIGARKFECFAAGAASAAIGAGGRVLQ